MTMMMMDDDETRKTELSCQESPVHPWFV